MERGLVSVDDLLDTLTRIASLAEFAQYRVRRQALNGVDCVARFEQIRDEALDGLERAEQKGQANCPCGDPVGGSPCSAQRPCPYAEGLPANRWLRMKGIAN